MKKKVNLLFILVFVIFIVTGCGNKKTLQCTMKNVGTNVNTYGDIKYTFKDDKIVSQHAVIEFKDFTVPDIDDNWETYVEQFTKQNKSVDESGYKRTVESDDKNHIFKVVLDVDYSKITNDTMNNYGIDPAEANATYDEMKESMLDNEDVISCK